jgi:ABC-type nitrate/sulfonate/bicarbonate transport system permease component
MVLFGIGETSKLMAAAIAGFFPMLINSQAGVRAISPLLFEVLESYGARNRDVFLRVVLPGSLPMILAGLRISVNVGLIVTIAVEFVSAKRGLGTLIWLSWETFRTEDLYAGVIVIAVLGIAFAQFLRLLNRVLTPWQPESVK